MDLEGLDGLDGFTLARIARIEAERRTVMPPVTPLRRRLPAAFGGPTRPERSRRRGKPAGTQAGARDGARLGPAFRGRRRRLIREFGRR
jgi:hypothetical protein